MPHLHSLAHRRNAGADVRDAVHIHHAVRTLAGDTQQAARTMVFETAGEDALAGPIERGRDRVSRLRFDQFVIGSGISPRFSPGKKDSRTSLDIVFRTAWSHCRQPER